MISLVYSFTTQQKAKETLYALSSTFSDSYGLCLYEFDSLVCLALFPTREIVIYPSRTHNPWDELKEKLGFFMDSPLTLHPTWMGALCYEMGHFSFSDVPPPSFESPYPLAHFFKHSIYMVLEEKQLTLMLYPEHAFELLSPPPFLKDLFQPSFWDQQIHRASLPENEESFHFEEQFLESKRSYLKKIETIQSSIRKGDLFQINLTQAIHYQTSLSAFGIYLKVTQNHPTPFSCFIHYGAYQIICSSPERFLSLEKGKLQTRPIKGTLKRLDHEDEKALLDSLKEQAELTMICDLMRNDLGRVSKLGTVKCIHLRKLLTLPTLYHMESVIESQALDLSPIDLIRPCFPPGSITGCPKVKAMDMISRLEKRARHFYCGAIGYFKSNGDFDFNVAIRTAVYHNKKLEYQVGGGLTVDSDGEKEYEETLAKALGLTQALLPKKKLLLT